MSNSSCSCGNTMNPQGLNRCPACGARVLPRVMPHPTHVDPFAHVGYTADADGPSDYERRLVAFIQSTLQYLPKHVRLEAQALTGRKP